MVDSLEVKSPLHNLVEMSDSDAQGRLRETGVCKKRGAKARADEQGPDGGPTAACERVRNCEAHIHHPSSLLVVNPAAVLRRQSNLLREICLAVLSDGKRCKTL